MKEHDRVEKTTVVTATGTVKTGDGYVFWVLVTASGGVVSAILRDGGTTIDTNGLQDGGVLFQRMDPPLHFRTSLNIVKVGAGSMKMTVAYD